MRPAEIAHLAWLPTLVIKPCGVDFVWIRPGVRVGQRLVDVASVCSAGGRRVQSVGACSRVRVATRASRGSASGAWIHANRNVGHESPPVATRMSVSSHNDNRKLSASFTGTSHTIVFDYFYLPDFGQNSE